MRGLLDQPITYSLRLNTTNSRIYHQRIAAFADQWCVHALALTQSIGADFRAFQRAQGLPARSDDEYSLELLGLGVLIHCHQRHVRTAPRWGVRLLGWLSIRQSQFPKLEAVAKLGRGLLNGLISLLPRIGSQDPLKQETPIQTLEAVLSELQAQEEMAIHRRLSEWRDYLSRLSEERSSSILVCCEKLVMDFEAQSLVALGAFTRNVPIFLREQAPRHRWSYDLGFVSRCRLEYHFGMLATEVLNRAYRQRFQNTQRNPAGDGTQLT